jgi:minor extracellular serine protease Vpr
MFKKFVFSIALIVILATSSLSPVGADDGSIDPLTPAPSAETGEMTDETPQVWFVELSGAPSIEGTSSAVLKGEHDDFRHHAEDAHVEYSERSSYETLWNGFTVSATPSELSKIRAIPGVTGIYPVETLQLPESTPSDPELFTALAMTGADVAQSELGYTGKGIRVGVIDTGIDVNHPAFGGNGVAELNSSFFYRSPRIKYGYDFVGDAFDANTNPVAVPDPIPDDCAGHGTHVAGIIGANDPTNGMKGVAPNVTFGAYRVFGCAGSTTSDIMLMAMERAYRDHMQVINMSIGSAFQWPQYPTAVAASRLVKKGVVVVASIGNNGANGLYSAGAPGLGENVIGVASFDNTSVMQSAFSISPDNKLVGFNRSDSPISPTNGTFPIARTGTITTANDACVAAALPAGSLTGKIALIRRGTCSFYIKSANAQAAGAVAVVLYNNTTGGLSPTVAGTPAVTIPVVAITAADGVLINSRLDAGAVNLTWGTDTISAVDPRGGLISSFSSYGLSPDLALKPDIGAPGGNIWSSYPLELGGYASLSGTSMSSPHVAGAAALFLQARPRVKAADVRTYLQNTALPKNWQGNPGLGYLDQVSRQGAGMLQIDKAILTTAIVEPSKLALGESQAGPSTKTLMITNSGKKTVTYTFSSVNALSVANTFAPAAYTSDAAVAFSAASITVKAGKSANVKVTITPATGPDKAQYGGYIILNGSDGSVLRVPFAGFIGDYQSIQALTPTPYGFPWLAISLGGSFYGPVTGPADWTYTMVGEDVPYLLIHFDHQVTRLAVEVYDATTGKAVDHEYKYAFVENYLPRNSTSTGFFAFAWDGTLIEYEDDDEGEVEHTMTVPNGQYILVVKALKALGNHHNPADWETWTSPIVEIARP